MTINATDFSEYTTDAFPSGWTDFYYSTRFDNSIVESNSAVMAPVGSKKLSASVSSGSHTQILTWDDVGSVDDCDILVKWSDMEMSSLYGPYIGARVSGTSASPTLYRLEVCYRYCRLSSIVAGTDTTIAARDHEFDSSGGDLWVRFKLDGSSLKVKYWAADAVEPANWIIEVTNTAIGSTGAVGIGSYYDSYSATCDYFACGDGESAAYPPSGWVGDVKFGTVNLDYESVAHPFGELTTVNFMGGDMVESGRTLNGLRIAVAGDHTDQIRCAVYSGGTVSNPNGATLLHDFGETTGSEINGWCEYTGADVAVPVGPLWVGFKGDGGFDYFYSDELGNCGNFENDSGRFRTTSGVLNDPSVAWPGTLVVAGSRSPYWYAIEAVFEAKAGDESSININLGSTEISKMYLGGTEVTAAYLGSQEL